MDAAVAAGGLQGAARPCCTQELRLRGAGHWHRNMNVEVGGQWDFRPAGWLGGWLAGCYICEAALQQVACDGTAQDLFGVISCRYEARG